MECPLLAQSSHWTAWPRMAAPDPKRTFARPDPASAIRVIGRRSNCVSCVHGADYLGCEHRFFSPPRQFAVSSGPQSFR